MSPLRRDVSEYDGAAAPTAHVLTLNAPPPPLQLTDLKPASASVSKPAKDRVTA